MLQRLKKIIVFLGDLSSLQLALLLTLLIRYQQGLGTEHWRNHWPIFWPVFIIFLFILYINDLYDLNLRVLSRKFLWSTMRATLISSFLSIIYFYLNTATDISPKTNLLIFNIIFISLFFLWRLISQLAIHSLLLKENIALIGSNTKSAKILEELQNRPGSGYQVAWVCQQADDLHQLPDEIKNRNIHTLVVCDDFGANEKISAALFACLNYKVNFFSYPDFYELIAGKIPVEAIGPDWFLENIQEGQKNYFNALKQAVDIAAAAVILLASLPLWPLIAIAIKASSRGPIFFQQKRLGWREKEFTIIKFRTMRIENNNLSPTVADDKRITGVGVFLRQTRLDEIPQVLNILKGDMSLIGPRPERPEIAAELTSRIPFYKTRLLIKPGLTGWDQISGKYHSASLPDSLEKLQYDLFYLKRRSAYLDVSILFKTLATMLGRQGL